MGTKRDEALQELTNMTPQLNFTSETPDLQSGKYWTIYVHPWLGDNERLFDAQINITPTDLEVEITEKIRLLVYSDNIAWLPNESFNRRGVQTLFFKALPATDRSRSFTARLVGLLLKDALAAAPEVKALAAETNKKQTAELPHGGINAHSSRKTLPQLAKELPPHFVSQQLYYLPDRRIVAILDKGGSEQAVLTIQTHSSELEASVIKFAIGDESGEVTLNPRGQEKKMWRGSYRLRQSFDEAVANGPIFGDEALRKAEESRDDI